MATGARDAAAEHPSTYVDSPGQWVRLYGVRYVAPFTFGHDDSALIVNGDRFEIEWDDRPLAEQVRSAETSDGPVYSYVGERLLAVKSSLGTIPADSLTAIVAEANSLLAAKQIPPIDLVLDGDLRYGNVLRNGRPVGAHIPVAPYENMPRSEVVTRLYEGFATDLQGGYSVIWGEDYYRTFSPGRAAGVDSALVAWGESVKVAGSVPNDDRSLVVHGVRLWSGVLRDVGWRALGKQVRAGW